MARPQEFNSAEALQKALGVFWRKGYAATTLEDLLGSTGLSKSSLYATFGSKRELFLKAFDSYRAARTIDMERVLAQGSARKAIETFFVEIIAGLQKPEPSEGCMSTNQAVEMAPHDAEVRDRVEADFQLIEDALATTIERGQKEGSIASTRRARELARLLVIAFPGLQVMVRARGGKSRLDDGLKILLANLD